MPPKDPINWMLSEAIETLARAERLHQQFLNLQPGRHTRAMLGAADRRAGDRPRGAHLGRVAGRRSRRGRSHDRKGALVDQRPPRAARGTPQCPNPPPRTAAGPVRAPHPAADGPLRHQPLRCEWLRWLAPRQIQLRRSHVIGQRSTHISPTCRPSPDQSVSIPEDALIIVPVRNTVLFPGVVVPITIRAAEIDRRRPAGGARAAARSAFCCSAIRR